MLKFTLVVAALVAVLVLVFSAASPSGAQVQPEAQKATACGTEYRLKRFHRAARRVYDKQNRATRSEKQALAKVNRCMKYPRKTRERRIFHTQRYRRAHNYGRDVAAVTPYGPWAIPAYIVECESGGDWYAYNPSGAVGPYQLLGKGAPHPADTRAERLAHHRIAYHLWAGGAGASHWVCA